jgi:hypothetical protein
VKSGKINCTHVLLKFHEYYAPVHELSLSTTNRCTQTQLIIKNSCTQLKYSSTHCNRGRSCLDQDLKDTLSAVADMTRGDLSGATEVRLSLKDIQPGEMDLFVIHVVRVSGWSRETGRSHRHKN